MKLLLVFILLFLINSHVFSVQLNSSIMIFNESDLSQCEKSMEKAKNLNNKSVNIVLTLLVEINELKEVQKLYFKDKSAKPYPLGINFSNLLKDSLSSCIKKANELNIKPTLTVHIDDLKSKEWRHFINISPLKLYQGFSLEKDVYSPVIDALLLSKYPANLFLLGEMDLSYSLHSNEYNQIAKDYFDKLNIGVSFNYNKLFRAKPLKKVFFRMVGFSNYLPVPENCSAKSFQNHIRTIRIELKKVHLEKLPLQFNEIGLGGVSKVASVKEMLQNPHKGVSGAYAIEKDPWGESKKNLARLNYYKCLMDYLKETKEITNAFIWNLDSWDFQGLYPYSKNYENPKLIEMVKSHND